MNDTTTLGLAYETLAYKFQKNAEKMEKTTQELVETEAYLENLRRDRWILSSQLTGLESLLDIPSDERVSSQW